MACGNPVIYSREQRFGGQFEERAIGYNAENKDTNEIADRIVVVKRNHGAISRNCVNLPFAGSLTGKILKESTKGYMRSA